MKKLHQLFGYERPKEGDFGIEIEVEGNNLVEVQSGGWTSVKDGSLRGESYEYVFSEPVIREKVKPQLEFLAKKLHKSELNFSFRTSVHVHMNMMDCTEDQVMNVIYLYLLLEEPFLTYCGKERKGNRFCLRLQDAEGLMDAVNMIFVYGFKGIQNINRDTMRYASINLEALVKYGSLEFRAMHGNLDVQYIDTWVEALYRIRKFAMEIKDPIDIYNLYAQMSPIDFMEKVLGDISKTFTYPRIVKDMQKSFSLSIDLPYTYRDKNDPKKKKKAIKDINFNDVVANIPPPVARLYDINGNEFRKGDIVQIKEKIEDAELNWEEEMDEFVDDGAEYVVVRTINEPDGVELDGLPWLFPPKSLVIRRRGEF